MDYWVFAYGSNMHLADLKRWFQERGRTGGSVRRSEAATVADYRLIWNYYAKSRKGGAANVERAPGQRLHGAALLVDEPTLLGLDTKEGHPLVYRRSALEISLSDGQAVEGYVYEVQASHRQNEFTAPARAYLRLLIEGAIDHGLPDAHVERLRRVPTRD